MYNGGSWVRKGKIKKAIVSKSGYLQMQLCKNGEPHTWRVHRLVAMTWLDNPNGLSEINHKNEQKDDNRVSNLEWCSRKYNINYGTARKRTGIANGITVVQYTLEGDKIREFYSGYEAQRQLGILEQSINLCCQGKRQHAGGFRWKYANDSAPFTEYKPRESAVVQKKNGRIIRKFSSVKEAYNTTRINNISACCRGVIKNAGGYQWQYLDKI